MVSICVPNFNTRAYLPERFNTIFSQTFTNWELIVCDSYSDDGGWEYIEELAKHEPRMRIYQTPRKGIYAGFNDCIKEAKGKYVYIATSDDTMMPDCLEWMVSTLEANHYNRRGWIALPGRATMEPLHLGSVRAKPHPK